jgi:pantetheine-phosphate adenylyltransferase
MRIGLYPGTFDPITLGHLDIIRRACSLVDRLVIGIAINRDKAPLFSLEERVEMVERECSAIARDTSTEIVAHPFENLLIHCAEEVGASFILRGLRAVSDFEYEFQMVGMNRAMNDSIETVFLMADAHYQAIASRLVKEIAQLDGDVRGFVPPRVAVELVERLRARKLAPARV